MSFLSSFFASFLSSSLSILAHPLPPKPPSQLDYIASESPALTPCNHRVWASTARRPMGPPVGGLAAGGGTKAGFEPKWQRAQPSGRLRAPGRN